MNWAWWVPGFVDRLLYWYLLYPVHAVIFSGMARALAHQTEKTAASE
jgi:hypothetical protein